MPLFNGGRKRKKKELEREVHFKLGIGRVRRYVEKSKAYSPLLGVLPSP